MVETSQQIAARIREYCKREKISPATFGAKINGNGKLVDRLEGGGSCTLVVYGKILEVIGAPELPSGQAA